jgi:hypothetical protein
VLWLIKRHHYDRRSKIRCREDKVPATVPISCFTKMSNEIIARNDSGDAMRPTAAVRVRGDKLIIVGC